MTDTLENRCRLVIIRGGDSLTALAPDQLTDALRAGDVASLILSPLTADGVMEETQFLTLVTPLVQAAQAEGVAVIVERHSRAAGRAGADGLQLGQDALALEDAVERLRPAMMVGTANVKTRHNALVLGELQPDYMFFGMTGGDTRAEPNPKNLALGQWWSALVEVPCIVQGGRDVDSVKDVAATGAEFVALDAALDRVADDATLVPDADAMAAAIARANELLDAHAPRFDES